MKNRPRLSTGQVARQFKIRHCEALAILKAAKIDFARLGNEGPFLWDAEAVNALFAAITSSTQRGDHAEI